MSVFFLSRDPTFPHPCLADADGLLAIGGDLSPVRLVAAYSKGIFPWYGPDSPVLWWSPDPRLILYPDKIHIPRSLRRTLNSCKFSITADTSFQEVIQSCAVVPRSDGHGTWLVPEMISAYVGLHRAGIAHSFEAWNGSRLVGGVYGVALGRAFFGESMFYLESNASKVALIHLVRFLEALGFHFMDCQQTTEHMLRFGAKEIPRNDFLTLLGQAIIKNPAPGKWSYRA
ncbi:leucyl/phenylalanyl-tRNA--protein transferase [Desulfonatronovibrio hydrogenovorans]|uniref:leucyl/phenylalanyl-tRNA--protein transferase n=1 Tax=Desulfonatronovibrio hydrogenovorans TaxID=53245 RepID=UPI0004918B48|nr:leucyl/phenylalanyl-tRNA--protein transferase [Desulfonatronovibrio hydrogenovorans]